MLPRIVALIAASTILVGLASTVAATIAEPSVGVDAARLGVSDTAYSVERSGLPTLSPDSAMTADELARLDGTDLLQALGGVDPVTLRELALQHPNSLASLLDAAPPAMGVHAWWAELDSSKQEALIDAVPRFVGNLEGVPYRARDAANRLFLDRTIASLVEQIAQGTGSRTAREASRAQLEMLREIESAADGTAAAVEERSLVSVDVEWPGRAAIALGDLDVAEYVSYLVPGMFFTIQGQIVDWTEIAESMHLDKLDIVQAESVPPEQSNGLSMVATVAWMGYQTPNVFTVGTLDQAREGSRQLDATVAGLRAVRAAEQPYVSLITHSYGSTAASLSLARGTLDIDAIALAGSPGVSVATAAEMGLDRGAVFVAEAPWDPVVDIAFHGRDPGDPEFGAVLLAVTGGVDAVTGAQFGAATGHLGYFSEHSEAMRNFALIGLGRGDLVTSVTGNQLLAAG